MERLECPRCHSEDTDPTADLVYLRECNMCLYKGEEGEFAVDRKPTYSWHILEHDGVAWQIIQVKHWPTRITLENLQVVLTEQEAKQAIEALRIAAPEMGRDLEYPDEDYK